MILRRVLRSFLGARRLNFYDAAFLRRAAVIIFPTFRRSAFVAFFQRIVAPILPARAFAREMIARSCSGVNIGMLDAIFQRRRRYEIHNTPKVTRL